MNELRDRVFLKPKEVKGETAAERIPAPPGEHRTGEDWGEANPLMYWSFLDTCDSLGIGSSCPRCLPGEGGVWGKAPGCTR
jgi:hypothetical protein